MSIRLTCDSQLEQAAQDALEEYAEWLAEAVGPIWAWGDGAGGVVWQVLAETFVRAGLSVEPRSIAEAVARLPEMEANARMASDAPRKVISHRRRRAVFERDAYRCRQCADWHDLQIDHILPVVLGGSNDVDNLQTLCRECNARKGARHPDARI